MKAMIDYWRKKGANDLQNCNAKLIQQKYSPQKCESKCSKCTLRMYERHMQSEETVNRSWQCFFLVKEVSTAASANSRQLPNSRLHMADSLTGSMLVLDLQTMKN